MATFEKGWGVVCMSLIGTKPTILITISNMAHLLGFWRLWVGLHVTDIERKDQVGPAGYYDCSVYITMARGATNVFTSKLRMESKDFDEKTWILSGVSN